MWILMLLTACAPDPAADPVSNDEDTVDDRTVTLAPPARGYQMVTEPYVVPPYTEANVCSVVRLAPEDADLLAWVNRFESLSSEGSHHMNVMIGQFSFLDGFLGDGAAEAALGATVGQYDCDELNAMEQAYDVFPTQRTNQQIVMPDGVAAPMLVPLVAIFNHHYVNSGDTPIRINAALNLETIPSDQVQEMAQLVFDDIRDLDVPSGMRQTVQRTCLFDRDVTLALVSTHNHEWTECASLHDYDGTTGTVTEEPFFVNKRWDQPPILHFEPGTRTVQAGDGIHWACHIANDTDRSMVNDGTAKGEMCVFAAVAYPSVWTVEQVEQTVATSDLAGLARLLGEAMGPCTATLDDAQSPFPAAPEPLDQAQPACAADAQTESNVLE